MNNNGVVFYVAAPDYTEMSSGRKVLHVLCDELNKLGFEAYVTTSITNPKLRTPSLNSNLLALHREQKRMQIAIYPEIWMDNPLGVPYVIRWLLNKPNYFQKNWFGSFPKEECIWHFMPEFRPPWIESTYQHLGLLDRSVFNLDGASNKRDGFIIYKNRIEGKEKLPDWMKKIEYISIDNPKSSYECSQLYKNAKALILYERAACHAEAALCGCTVITREHPNFDPSFIFDSYWKLSTIRNFEKNLIDIGQTNGSIVNDIYDLSVIANREQLRANINEAIYKLKYSNTQKYVSRSAIIEESLRSLAAKDFEKAQEGWNYLLEIDEYDLKSRYFLTQTLIQMKDIKFYDHLSRLIKEIEELNVGDWMQGMLTHLIGMSKINFKL